MKKNLKLMAVIIMAVTSLLPARADLLTVCNGTATSYQSPINSIWVDTEGTRTQVIYPAADLAVMAGQCINSVKFYIDGAGCAVSGGQQSVSVGETTMSAFDNVYATGLTRVATLTMTAGVTEILIEFDTPYLYNGGNLVVETLVEQETDYAVTNFLGIRTSTYTTMTRGEVERFLPKATFDYGIQMNYAAAVEPEALAFGGVHIGRELVKDIVLLNTGTSPFTPVIGTLAAPFSVDAQPGEMPGGSMMTIPVKFTPSVMGECASTLTIDCGGAGIIEVPVTGSALAPVTDLTVCDSTAYNAHVPTYGLYYDKLDVKGQMIYPESMLTGMAGKQIVALTFYARNTLQIDGGNILLSLKNESRDHFTSETALTGFTAVANASPVDGQSELTFVFSTPFEYTGGNLAVEALVTEIGAPGTTYFLGVETEQNTSYAYYNAWGENHELIKFLPKATFTYVVEETPVVRLGDVNGDGQVNITDVTQLIAAVLNDNFSGVVMANSDMDGSGTLNITDITMLINYVLNMN